MCTAPYDSGLHYVAGEWPKCTAPTEAQHIEHLTVRVAELEYDLDLSRRLDDVACKKVTDLQAANAVLRAALEEIKALSTGWKHGQEGIHLLRIQQIAFPAVEAALSSEAVATESTFRDRVKPWLEACFGEAISNDREERNHRFLEEALEAVQSLGASKGECLQLVEYVYGRQIGEPSQEVGGVMVTLAALCLANGIDMHESGETELRRIWTKVDEIRAKQAAKPRGSVLPIAVAADVERPELFTEGK